MYFRKINKFFCFLDLSALGELSYLLTLNVSNNEIERLIDFLPPYNLKEANFSFNKIEEIGNLTNFHYLQTLELNSKSAILVSSIKIGKFQFSFHSRQQDQQD